MAAAEGFLLATLFVLGGIILVAGFVKLFYVPLAIAFDFAAARKRRPASLLHQMPMVSVIVPAFNESIVVANCVQSIIDAGYPNKEIILVDDGSTDDTAAVMSAFAKEHAHVTFLRQENGGKGSALNAGAAVSSGEILIFVDADSLFLEKTIENMLRGFNHQNVGAVCGDDRPVNLNSVLTRMLTIISHIGTGLVRRALTTMRCLPIVSGNSGAFRRDVLALTGPFNTHTVGEDMELTWRVHKAGYRVNFCPRALVYAESPSTLRGLWKQRVRWARGLLQTTWLHRDMVGDLRYGSFGAFLAFNTFSMVLVPMIQLLIVFLLPAALLTGHNPLPTTAWETIGWLGLATTVILAVIAIALNRAWSDLRHLWTVPLWPIYSVFIAFTLATALYLEIARRPSKWNKLERTGVVSIGGPRKIAAASS